MFTLSSLSITKRLGLVIASALVGTVVMAGFFLVS